MDTDHGIDDRAVITRRILASAIDVHRALGPGLLETTYRTCLVHRLRADGLHVEEEVPISIQYQGLEIDHAFRADLIVERTAVLELKAVDRLLPIHRTQLFTYMKLSGLRVGLLINFNVERLVNGVRRVINRHAAMSD